MIEWRLVADSYGDITNHDLMSSSLVSIKELDSIEFVVKISDDVFNNIGTPFVSVGDIPIELEFSNWEENLRVFRSPLGSTRNDNKLFYNFFGQSDLLLHFEKTNEVFYTKIVDILARRENAVLADNMLNYLTTNIEDAIQICFSRSRVSATLNDKSKFEFSKIDIIKQSIEHLTRTFAIFRREHKYQWEQELHTSEQGQPIGPDSVDWALKNLDKLSPSAPSEANIMFNNRGYAYPELPKEVLVKNTDTYENRVVSSYLKRIENYLSNLFKEYNKVSKNNVIDNTNEYVRFDHTMAKFAGLALKFKSKEINALILQVGKLRALYSKIIPSKIEGFYPPKMTSYVAKHNHYRVLFQHVENFNKAPSPNLVGNELLLGLKNLSIVYEITCLVSLYKTIETYFSASIVEQGYYEHNYENGYGGKKKKRPTGVSNNYFQFSNSSYTFELEYEPKIFQMNVNSKAGDLIDTSRNRAHPIYGPHYFSPDFVLRIRNNLTDTVNIVIMDAKYKDRKTISDYDLKDLTNKYLLNIHQLKTESYLGVSPIKLVLALFAHDRTGTFVSNVSNTHALTGEYPLLPQSAAIHYLPDKVDLLTQQLTSLIAIVERDS
ncbi:hypothetical protein K6U51_16665 [Vibrio fluvialis]|uniref:hypothetical protein n=1 Tax=Vibrio fluvialis TaxID=676 RepID=UPI001EECCB81|nr:hypothetical protein [Vibrio fluvialis]MCG6390620.1 hypothetical protein [Vibrio fluvialis]MCG6419652.1 hypothetical protein [Vibrio fluvialis]